MEIFFLEKRILATARLSRSGVALHLPIMERQIS